MCGQDARYGVRCRILPVTAIYEITYIMASWTMWISGSTELLWHYTWW